MRFSYEYQETTHLFKFYDDNYLTYLCQISNKYEARQLAEQLIKEVEDIEQNQS